MIRRGRPSQQLRAAYGPPLRQPSFARLKTIAGWDWTAAPRWLSPDPAGLAAANPADPQSWNRYAYVGNQPLSAADPLGLCTPQGCIPVCGGPCCYTCGLPTPPPYTFTATGIAFAGFQQDAAFELAGPPGMNQGKWKPKCDCKDDRPKPDPTPRTPRAPTTVPPSGLKPTWIFIPLPPFSGLNYCGPGDAGGAAANQVDAACERHDECYANAGANAWNSLFGSRNSAREACDAQLCNELGGILPATRTEAGDETIISWYFRCHQ